MPGEGRGEGVYPRVADSEFVEAPPHPDLLPLNVPRSQKPLKLQRFLRCSSGPWHQIWHHLPRLAPQAMRTTHGAASHRRHSDTPSRDDAVRDEVGSPRHREHRGRAGSEQVQVSVRFQGVKRTRYAQCEFFRV